MGGQEVSAQLQLDGSLLTMPAKLALKFQNGKVAVYGSLETNQARPEAIIREINADASAVIGQFLEQVTDNLPDKLLFLSEDGQNLLWMKKDGARLGLVWMNQSFECLFGIQRNEQVEKGTLSFYLSEVQRALGIEKVYVYAKWGSGASLPLLTKTVLGNAEEFRYPMELEACSVLFCGKFSFDKDKDLIGKFLYEAFKLDKVQFSLLMGMSNEFFAGYAMIPVISGGVLNAEELYFGIEIGKTVAMKLAGTFRFSFVENAIFHVSSSLSFSGFQLEAFAELAEPVTVFKNFRVGDTALAIGVENAATTFRMFSNLYLGDIKAFGAIGLKVAGTVPVPEFLSAAITDVTLPKLIHNVFGANVTFADRMDFIKLSGLPLGKEDSGFLVSKTEDVKDKDVKERIVKRFNEVLPYTNFKIQATSTTLERMKDSDEVVLVDKSRMRHYSINSKGKLNLQAQFFYSIVDVKLGDYAIKKGIFLCSCITLFQKYQFKTLFSISEDDGILAYANISEMDFGILSIGESGLATTENPLDAFPKDNIIWLLMDDTTQEKKGAVFFLRACKEECSFYIDGRITLFSVFCVAARIQYTQGMVSVDTHFQIANLITTTLKVSASYGDFTDMNFALLLVIDCTGIEKMLRGVQESIEKTVNKLRDKMGNAREKIKQAKENVYELHSQIANLDSRINSCIYDIKHAKWYKKAFVAIAKGIEIAAYEVAKAALYAAIGVANTALEVALLAVNLGEKIGVGVLKFVEAGISALLNFFYVKYIRLEALASMKEQYFQAEIEVVVLGKTFHFTPTIGAKQLFEKPTDMLGDSISQNLQPQLDNIENGTFKSNRMEYKEMECSMMDYMYLVGTGMDHLDAGTSMLKNMSDIYMENCGEVMPEYKEFVESYANALGEAQAVLAVPGDTILIDEMDPLAERIKSALKDGLEGTEEDIEKAKDVLANYDSAKELMKQMTEGTDLVRNQKKELFVHMEDMRQKEALMQKEHSSNTTMPTVDMETVLNETERTMYDQFPVSKGAGDYINLAREHTIREYFDEARMELGYQKPDDIIELRSKSSGFKYNERL